MKKKRGKAIGGVREGRERKRGRKKEREKERGGGTLCDYCIAINRRTFFHC